MLAVRRDALQHRHRCGHREPARQCYSDYETCSRSPPSISSPSLPQTAVYRSPTAAVKACTARWQCVDDSRHVDVARPVETQGQGAGDGGDVANAGDRLDHVIGAHDHGEERAVEDQPQSRQAQHRRRLQQALSARQQELHVTVWPVSSWAAAQGTCRQELARNMNTLQCGSMQHAHYSS